MNIFDKLRERGFGGVPERFYDHVAAWDSWYRGDVDDFHRYTVFNGMHHVRCRRYTMGMAKKIAEDWADLVLNEHVSVTLAGAREQEFFDQVCRDNDLPARLSQLQERKFALGTAAWVPRVEGAAYDPVTGRLSGGRIRVDLCAADCIFPLRWEAGRVRECAFAARHAAGGRQYVSLQIHRLAADGTYDIENVMYRDQNGDLTEVPLGAVPGFERVPPVVHTGSGKPQFVIDRPNIVNNIDPALPMGVSVYANAIDQLKGVDIAYDSYVNEFVLGKKRIIVKPEAARDLDGAPLFDPNDTVYYVLPEDSAGGSLIDPVDMTLRTAEHNAGMQDMLNALASKCGLGENRYRFDQGGVATATQVVSENSAMFRSMRKHEIILEDVLTELARIVLRLGNGYLGLGLDEDTAVAVDFDDSVIVDEETRFDKTLRLLGAGLLRPWEARARLLKESEETAKKMLEGE